MRPLLLYKPPGLTPLAAIKKLQEQHPEFVQQTLSYAGRLDPMAEGLLLILRGEQNKQRTLLEAHDKTYEFTLLCGVSTDTFDLLGKVTKSVEDLPSLIDIEQRLIRLLSTLPSSFSQPYPPYSSKPVHGKPLYWWARNNRLDEISIPKKDITITSLTYLSSTSLPQPILFQNIGTKIDAITGDFRQKEILDTWDSFFATTPLTHFPLLSFSITCSSGTYVRALCELFGEKIGIPSLAYAIKRTAVGTYTVTDTDVYYLSDIGKT